MSIESNLKSMTSGVLTVIGCPILEDELIYSILSDSEEKNIFIIETEHSKSLERKFGRHGIEYDKINEYSFLNRMGPIDRSKFNIVIKMLDMALHREPKDLRSRVEDEVVRASEVSDVIALYYGMCGNHGWDITEWAEGNGLCPVLVFRDKDGRVCDDCVGVAVGGVDKYRQLLKAHTGQMLFTPGVAVNWDDFLASNEMFTGLPEKSVEYMKWMFDLCGYDTVVKIDTGLGDRDEMDEATVDFASTYGFKIIEGDDHWPDLYPAEKIYGDAKKLLSH